MGVNTFTLKHLDDGTVRTPGIDYGAEMKIVRRVGKVLIVHCPGHKYWTGVGCPWAYMPTRFMLFEIVSEMKTENGYTYTVADRDNVEVGRQRKKSLAEAIRRAREISGIVVGRETMISRLVAWDLDTLQRDLLADDYSFAEAVVTGSGWKPYNQLSDDEIQNLYEEASDRLREMDEEIDTLPKYIQTLLRAGK